MDRRDEVEAGGAGVAGLDAVDAVDGAQQRIMVAHEAAAIGEGGKREILIILRKAMPDDAAEQRLVARGGDLFLRRQARRVDIGRVAHAKRARLSGHHTGEGRLVAAERLRDDDSHIVGRFGDDGADRRFDPDRLSRLESEFGWCLRGGTG